MKKKKVTLYRRLFLLHGNETKALKHVFKYYQDLIKKSGSWSFIGRYKKATSFEFNYSIIKGRSLEFEEKQKLSYPIDKDKIRWKTGFWVDLYYLDRVNFLQKIIELSIRHDELILRTLLEKIEEKDITKDGIHINL